MKRNRIFLDFTSLLDITMIILFWFLINFKNTADAIKTEAAEQTAQAQSYAAELEEDKKEFELEKEEWRREADSEMEKIREADKNAADNARALMDFQDGAVITINLNIESRKKWTVTVRNGNRKIGEIASENSADFTAELTGILSDAGFRTDDVVIGVLLYDSNDNGSYYKSDFEAYIDEVRREYKQFYCSSINISK
ncbi:MAG: hypothetical protein J1F11_08040 [Oscillospiraceae bacterium]|nr:hypothetical protein [Oscillospiraceae bacterium]